MENTPSIAPGADQHLTDISPVIKKIITKANELTVTDDESQAFAIQFLGDLKQMIKEIKAQKEHLTGGIRRDLKRIDNEYKMRLEPLTQADTMIREKANAYATEQQRLAEEAERKRREEQERLEREAAEAAAKAKTEEDKAAAEEAQAKVEQAKMEAAPAPDTTVRTASATGSTRKTWTAEIEDESKVPAEYLMVDTKKINQAVRDGVREIPGVKIYQKITTTIR